MAIGYCGVCCDHCDMQTRIPEMVKNLRRFSCHKGTCRVRENYESIMKISYENWLREQEKKTYNIECLEKRRSK